MFAAFAARTAATVDFREFLFAALLKQLAAPKGNLSKKNFREFLFAALLKQASNRVEARSNAKISANFYSRLY